MMEHPEPKENWEDRVMGFVASLLVSTLLAAFLFPLWGPLVGAMIRGIRGWFT